ncbi:transposase [Pyramidobacter sp. CG50-2]|uniref:transposase n=1 Tax=Pyramidobacter sp. CG50-2 TaxID=2382160 RepID=UPI000EA191C7|nr:transposase [Pyramidobacter sp. CG50-2]RKJ76671.1 transposase [Pyramidobacter sp. CG50-2]
MNLTSSEWNRFKRILPPEHSKSGQHGRPAKYDNRWIINGILWLAGSGAPWRELPEHCDKRQTVSEFISRADVME